MNVIADTLLLCGAKVNRENPQDETAHVKLTCANGWRRLKIEIRAGYDKTPVGKDGKVREKSVDKRGSMW